MRKRLVAAPRATVRYGIASVIEMSMAGAGCVACTFDLPALAVRRVGGVRAVVLKTVGDGHHTRPRRGSRNGLRTVNRPGFLVAQRASQSGHQLIVVTASSLARHVHFPRFRFRH